MRLRRYARHINEGRMTGRSGDSVTTVSVGDEVEQQQEQTTSQEPDDGVESTPYKETVYGDDIAGRLLKRKADSVNVRSEQVMTGLHDGIDEVYYANTGDTNHSGAAHYDPKKKVNGMRGLLDTGIDGYFAKGRDIYSTPSVMKKMRFDERKEMAAFVRKSDDSFDVFIAARPEASYVNLLTTPNTMDAATAAENISPSMKYAYASRFAKVVHSTFGCMPYD